jgi:multidrug efflux pump subunit AcrB
MTIPDDPTEVRRWLETIVVRGEVARLANELSVIQDHQMTAVGTVPRGLANAVCEDGFGVLNDQQLRDLMTNPGLLVALAEEIFINGGAYWTKKFTRTTAFEERVEAGRQRLMQELNPVVPAPMANPKRGVSPWLAAFVSAALVAGVFFIFNSMRDKVDPNKDQPSLASTKWGWQKTEELAKIDQPADYLERIADLAQEWKKQDTTTATALADRIAEFRQGCARLQLMEHKPLTEEQRKDLLARCQKWAKKFDDNLGTLETTGDVAKVRAAMDATVDQLSTVLREQAGKMRAG